MGGSKNEGKTEKCSSLKRKSQEKSQSIQTKFPKKLSSNTGKPKNKAFNRRTLEEEIKSILQQYPDDGQIFKEIIQNAEDAGASEVVFIYDKNEFKSQKPFSNGRLSKYQGPSLYSFNDALFEEDDWKGISSLGISRKVKDPLKVGRFGLGFKSVFHLTDMPCIVSGSTFVYLDPSKETFVESDGVVEFDMEENENLLMANTCAEFDCFRRLGKKYWENGTTEGTLFKFNLRQKPSVFSYVCYDDVRFQALIEKFLNEAYLPLIFLKNIKLMKMYVIENGTDELEEIYSISLPEESQHDQRQSFSKTIQNFVEKKIFNVIKTLDHELQLTQNFKGKLTKFSYVVSEYFGYNGENEQFNQMMLDEELSYVPLIAVALPVEGDDDGGHIFSALPLPLQVKCMTGMPVHINGFFALGQDRKDLKWRTLKEGAISNDKTVNWNNCLIQELLPVVYSNLLKFLIDKNNMNPETSYKAWPREDKVDQKWRMFLNTFYQIMYEIPCIYIESKNIWVLPKNTIFINNDSTTQVIRSFLEMSDKNITTVDPSITCNYPNKLNWVTSKVVCTTLKENPSSYQALLISERTSLLSFAITQLSDLEDVLDVPLFPLVNGNHVALSRFNEIAFYLITLKEVQEVENVLPTKDLLINSDVFIGASVIMESLNSFAKQGNCNLKIIDSCETIIDAIHQLIPKSWKLRNKIVQWPDSQCAETWIDKLTSYMRKNWDSLHLLEGIPFIPVVNDSGRFLQKLSTEQNNQPMLPSFINENKENISASIKQLLESLGVFFIASESMEKDDIFHLTTNNYILSPSSKNIIDVLESRYSTGDGCVALQNAFEEGGLNLKVDLCEVLATSEVDIPGFIRELLLFPVYKSATLKHVSPNNCTVADPSDVPEVWKDSMFPLVNKNNIDEKLLQKFGIRRSSYIEVCEKMLEFLCLLTETEQSLLFDFVLLKSKGLGKLPEGFIRKIVPHLHINSDGIRLRPSELFEVNDVTTKVFYGEDNKLADVKYDIQVLKQMGLRSVSAINSNDINASILNINREHLQLNGKEVLLKVEALLDIVEHNPKITLKSINTNLSWIPVAIEKFSSYPKHLLWFKSASSEVQLAPLNNVFTKGNEDFVGSICHLVHPQLNDTFETCFGTQLRQPTIAEIMKHLQNIHEAYSDEEKGLFKQMVFRIYEKISNYPDEVLTIVRENGMLVWHINSFIWSKQMTLTDISISLEPYFYKVTEEVTNFLEKVLTSLNCRQKEFELYLIVLKKIAERNEKRMPEEFPKDYQLSIAIIKHLANHELENSLRRLSEIYVPVESEEGLWLHPLTECFYIDKKKSAKYTATASSNKILHRDLGKEIATSFKIPNLLSKVLGGKKSSFIKPWGQTEPLTRRLNKLLEEYQDGLAIIKELVQNADDAGASQFKILYDKRQNNDMKDHLIDCNMSEWQGPALWVYNDKNFTEADFQNITKINAGSKEYDTKKIGKFGLGFNSVYHLTDVPSFLSGDSLVIFDPHAEYLGEALESKDVPGIRVPLSENIKELISFKHQFEVFNGVFGAEFNFNTEKPFKEYLGTLFRLPLRNHKTAEKSEIKKLVYSDNEVRKLLQMLEKSLDDLLLFTENINSVEVWELKNNDMPKLEFLYSVSKSSAYKSAESSIISIANRELEAIKRKNDHKIQQDSTITETKMEIRKSGLPPTIKLWLTVSTIGSLKTFQYAAQHKGHLPCGGISMPIINNNDGIDFDGLRDIIFEGKMFCFLPLPINSCLPFHVNGAFEISRNRQSLVKHSTDEKDYDRLLNWNDILGSDLGQAYFELLCQVALRPRQVSLDKWASVLFPKNIQLHETHARNMITGMLQKVLASNNKIFPASQSWRSWSSLRILEPGFSECILPASLSFINWYYSVNDPQFECVVFPTQLHVLLKEFGFEADLNKSMISQTSLFKIFLHSIGNTNLDVSIRNTILNHILQFKPEENELKGLLKSTKCIPTKPAGTLKQPSQLVEEDSKASTVFFNTDEVFPMVEKQHLDYLSKELGMHNNKLPWPIIMERAKSIEVLHTAGEIDFAQDRLKSLLSLMNSANICSTDMLNSLKNIAFLEVLPQPANRTFLKWHGEGRLQFGKPVDMFNLELKDVISCSAIICKHRLPKSVASLVNELPQHDKLCFQMKQIAAAYKDNNDVLTEDMVEVLDALYKRFDYNFTGLSDIECVRTSGDKLAKPSQVFFNIEAEIPCFLYQLHPFLKNTYHNLMSKIGVRLNLRPNDYVEALELIYEKYSYNQVVQNDTLKAIVHNVVPYLCLMSTTITPIYLPDKHGKMYLSNELCYEDVNWLPDEENVKYIHEEISRKHALQLHIKSLRADLFMKQADADELWSDFGQKEPLTTRIKNLLHGYSEPEDIFKEMFQNADDAGATEIEFILDTRMHGDKKVLSDKWKPLQGPALLVRNNAKFTIKDLKGIQNLGVGNKSEDPLSTGKYGVGFNAVYSLTDCPVLLTDVEGLEDVLCIFDPNLLYADGATERRPGRMLKGARKMLAPYDDVKSSLLFEELDSKGQTLFRFPLRTDEMASCSKISHEPVSIGNLKDLISEMKTRANDILLFLNNISQISFTEICKNGKVNCDSFIGKSFDISKEGGHIQFQVFQKEFPKNLKSVKSLLESHMKLTRKFCVQHFFNQRLFQVCHWDVVEQCGFSNISESNFEWYNETTQLIPKGGVAKLSKLSYCIHCQNNKDITSYNKHLAVSDEGVFCTLPLPIKTGIPAIINGNFILDYETRRNLWSNEGFRNERSLWNEAVLKGCVLPCYLQYMKLQADEIKGSHSEEQSQHLVQEFYNIFPLANKCTGTYWKTLTKEFYRKIHNLDLPLLLVERNGFITPCCAKSNFLVYNEQQNSSTEIESSLFSITSSTLLTEPPLLKVLQNADIPVDIIPDAIMKNFMDVECALTILTPAILRKWLVSMTTSILPNCETLLKDTVFENITNVLKVLKYCLNEEVTEKEQTISLVDLPLCVLANGTLTRFSETERKYFTYHTTLFSSKLAMFVHRSIYKAVQSKQIETSCFEEYHLDQFHALLAQCFPKLQEQQQPFPIDDSGFTNSWIKDIWQFFCSLKISEEKNYIIDLTKLDNWALLLVERNGENLLLPIKQRGNVLHLTDSSNHLNGILKKYGIFVPSKKIYPPEKIESIFGNVYSPNNLISALTLAHMNKSSNLAPNETNVILAHLKLYHDKIHQSSKTEFKHLSLFERYDGVLTPAVKLTVVLPRSIPLDGISFLQDRNSCIFLKHSEGLLDLYKSLGFSCLSWMTFYNEYLLPYVEEIKNEDMMFHIKFLYAEIRNMGFEHEDNQQLIRTLRGCKLFPSRGGEKKLCVEMYDPNNEIFIEMLSQDKFPNENYCDDNWLPFLKKLGLIYELTQDLFILFAKELESTDDINKLLCVSDMLCRKLRDFKYYGNGHLFNIISNIKFIVPSPIQKDYLQIANSLNSTVDRICFRGSCLHSNQSLLWTTSYILPKYSTNNMPENKKKTLDDMGVLNQSNIDSYILRNLQNILCNAPNNYDFETTTYRKIKENLQDCYEKVLIKFYNYILNQESMWKERLVDLPCILVNDGKGLEVPRRAVLSEEMTICPYLNPVPVMLGQHAKVLIAIGCYKKVSAAHLLDVLQAIQSISKDSVLGPNELENVKKVVCSLSNVLMKKEEGSEIECDGFLFLPTVTFTKGKAVVLTSSAECLLVDDCHLEERLKEFDAPLLLHNYIVSDTNLDPNGIVNKNLMSCLAVDRKPKLLSESIKEVLTESVLNEVAIPVDPSHVSNEIKDRIKNPFFISNVERLFLHENLDVSKVHQCLSNVKCYVKRRIQTHLLYKDQVIPGSEVEKVLFLRNINDCLEIYFCSNSSAGQELYSDIAAGILTILGNQLKYVTSIMAVPLLLSQDLENLSEILDNKGVSRNPSSSLYKSLGLPPIPGEPVPLELHELLRSDFSSFKIGEYVAVEQIDESETRHYRYAVFRRQDQNSDVASRLYGLQLTEDGDLIEDVAAYLVFKFDRGFLTGTSSEDENETEICDPLPDFMADFKNKSYYQIIKEIHEILRNLKNKDKKARKLILRRLYLTWHPDKHPDETKDLATKVFQYIQGELKKVKDGTIDCDDWDRQANGGWDRYRRYTHKYRERYHGQRGGVGGYDFNNNNFTPPTFEEFNPQPNEARRWWRQADFDIKIADAVVEGYEWVCYMSHQAAEKALKAAAYKIHYKRLMTHYLPNLAGSDSSLYEWATELQRLTRSAEAMRYPDLWSAPKIPHNQYTSRNAESAKELARQIVSYVRDMVN